MNQLLGGNSQQTPPYRGSQGSQQTLEQVLQFLRTTKITPQEAQNRVQQYLKDNSVSAEEFNRIGAAATQIMRALGIS